MSASFLAVASSADSTNLKLVISNSFCFFCCFKTGFVALNALSFLLWFFFNIFHFPFATTHLVASFATLCYLLSTHSKCTVCVLLRLIPQNAEKNKNWIGDDAAVDRIKFISPTICIYRDHQFTSITSLCQSIERWKFHHEICEFVTQRAHTHHRIVDFLIQLFSSE